MRCLGMDLEVYPFYNYERQIRHIAGYPCAGASHEAAAQAARPIRRKGFS
jgi:hypothetical protein